MPFLQNFSSNRNKALQKWKYACVIDAAHSSNACFWEISFSPWKGLMSLCSDVWAYLLSIYEQSLHLAGYSYQWRYIQLQELVNHCIVRALARFITTVLIVQLSPVFLFGEIESKVSKLKVSRKKMRFIYWILMPYRFLLYAILIQATLKYYHKPKKKKKHLDKSYYIYDTDVKHQTVHPSSSTPTTHNVSLTPLYRFVTFTCNIK